MKAISQFLFISILTVSCSGCGNGGIDISVDPPPPLPGQPQVTVEGETKQLVFSWAAVTGADHYRLMENPDGHSGFTQVGDDIPSGTLSISRDITVHLFDWVNAQYIVEACNVTGCSSSDVATTMDVMLDTIAYIKASNTETFHNFGLAVAQSADGNTLALGAAWEDSNATGINGDQADNSAENAGAVYLFRYDGTSWAQQAYIKASNTETWDYFGITVALSADGKTLAVGAREDSSATGINGDQADNSAERSGAVYVFRFDGTDWYQQAYVKASNTEAQDYFGTTVALSADGNTLAVGASFEDSNATGINGDQADNSAPYAGAVYLFRFDGTAWAQQAYIKASNTETGGYFGGSLYDKSLALSADGNTLAVGAYGEDSSATGINGDQTDNSAIRSGVVYLFRSDGVSWAQQAYIKASNTEASDEFGRAVALSADGNTLAVGASFEDSNATGINGDQADNSSESAGAVYLFRFDGTSWAQQAYIKASNTEDEDYFGRAVALSADGNALAVGALREDSSATGINGDQTDNSAENAGAVYVY